MLITGLYPSTQSPFQTYASVGPNKDVYSPTIIADFKNNVFAKGSLSFPGLLYPTTFDNLFQVKTRSSTATYYDEDGNIATASVDEIRKDTYDPSTVDRAYNIIGYSQDYSTGNGWAVIRGTVEKVPDAIRGEYIKYTETPDQTGTFGVRSRPAAVHAGAMFFTYSVSVKYVDAQYIGIGWKTTEWWNVNDGHFKIDLINGTIISSPIGNSSLYGLIDEGDGWYRLWWARTIASSNNFRVVSVQTLDPVTLTSGTRTNGSVGLSFLMANPSADYGKVFKKYVPNNTDGIVYETITKGKPTGLLMEAGRTNLFSNSSSMGSSPWQVWVGSLQSNATNIVNPTGSGGCDSIVSDGTNSTTRFSRVHTFPTDSYVCVSIFMKPCTLEFSTFGIQFNNETVFPGRQANTSFNTETMTITLATGVAAAGMQKLPNGWWRIWATNLTSSTSAGADIRFYTNLNSSASGNVTCVFGAQAEVGFFPSSYMASPVGSTTSRSTDILNITDMSGVDVSGAKGTLFADIYSEFLKTTTTAQSLISISDGTSNNQVYIKTGGPNGIDKFRTIVSNAGVATLNSPNSTNSIIDGRNVVAVSYGLPTDRVETSVNGTTTVTALNSSAPTNMNIIKISSNPTNSERGLMFMNKISYFPTPLPTENAQIITSL